jgi:hypothetical protein
MSETTRLETSMLERTIVDTIQVLTLAQQEAVLTFARSFSTATTLPTTPSLRELAKLDIATRHQVLAAYVPMMAADFRNDAELTEFSALDGEDWGE